MKTLSEAQIEKAGGFLLDIAKLMFGATVIPLFIPNNIFDFWIFIAGFASFLIVFGFGLAMLKTQKL